MALYAGAEIMRLLVDEYLSGLDPRIRSHDHRTPNDCFMHERSSTFTSLSESPQAEEVAWHKLLKSACVQNGVEFGSLGISRLSEHKRGAMSGDDSEGCKDDEGPEEYEDDYVDAMSGHAY